MESWELALPFSRRARLRVLLAPALGMLVALGLAVAGAVAVSRERLDGSQSIEAWFLIGAGLACAGYAGVVVRRRSIALAAGLPFLRVDDVTLGLRHDRLDDWLVVPWTSLRSVDLDLLRPPPEHPHTRALETMRCLRFVPADESEVPYAPPGLMDDLLGLSPAAARLTVVVDSSADDSFAALLAWLRVARPELPVHDRVPRGV